MEQEIVELIAGILNSRDEITLETEVGEPVEWDSLHNVEIIAALEKKYSIELTPEIIMDIETVEDIAQVVEELVG